MDIPITSIEIQTVIKVLGTNKSPGPDGITGEFYQMFRKELIPIQLQLLHSKKVAEEWKLPNWYYKITIILKPKPQKAITKKEYYRSMPLINIDSKIISKILANRIKQNIKKTIYQTKWVLPQRCKDSSTYANQSAWYIILTIWKIKTLWYFISYRESSPQN